MFRFSVSTVSRDECDSSIAFSNSRALGTQALVLSADVADHGENEVEKVVDVR